MKEVEIIDRTLKAVKRTTPEQSSDESAYDEIGELQGRLPEGGDKTCKDFRCVNVECCETCQCTKH